MPVERRERLSECLSCHLLGCSGIPQQHYAVSVNLGGILLVHLLEGHRPGPWWPENRGKSDVIHYSWLN
jgi:hypothetical protein